MTTAKRLAVAALCAALALVGVLLAAGPASAYPAKSPASISISPAHPQCGKDVTVSGRHYKPGEPVKIKVNGYTEATTTADSNGTWSVTFPLNCHGADAVTITATGADGDVDSLTVTVGGNNGSGNGSGSGSRSGGAGTNSGGTSGLSSTGVAVAGIGIVSVVLLLVGGVLLVAGKRRKTA